MRVALITFLVGGFAGLCSVFVPRMGGLFAARDIEGISVFPLPFVTLGVIYAAAIGIVVVILYHEEKEKVRLRQKFMTALGVPALIAGTLTTGAQTTEVRDLQQTVEQLSVQVIAAEGIETMDEAVAIEPLGPGPGVWNRGHELLGIGTAHAGLQPVSDAGAWGNIGAIRTKETRYAVVVYRSNDAQDARRRAAELKRQFPGARAVKMSGTYAVITGVLPRSAAVLEVSKVREASGLRPTLVRVK
jgi:hypothetical protein